MYKESEKTFKYETEYGPFEFRVRAVVELGDVEIKLPYRINDKEEDGRRCTIDGQRCAFCPNLPIYLKEADGLIENIPLPNVDEVLEEINRVRADLEEEFRISKMQYDDENLREDENIILISDTNTEAYEGLYVKDWDKSFMLGRLYGMWRELQEAGRLHELLSQIEKHWTSGRSNTHFYSIQLGELRTITYATYIDLIYPRVGQPALEERAEQERERRATEKRKACTERAKATGKRQLLHIYLDNTSKAGSTEAYVYVEPSGETVTEKTFIPSKESL